MTKISEVAPNVFTDDGVVLIDGPGAIAVTLTPSAAIELGERLGVAAIAALSQGATGHGGSSLVD